MVNKIRVQEKVEKPIKFYIDFQLPQDDDIFKGKELLDHIKTNMKVNQKKGNLDGIEFSIVKKKILVESKVKFSKRYLKYLTKKFLKKKDIIEFLRLVASDKSTYKIKYVNEDIKDKEDLNE